MLPGFWFKVGAPCCSCGCRPPTVCVKAKGGCGPFAMAASFPFADGFVEGPVCACCFLSCFPNQGCMKPPKKEGGAPATVIDDVDAEVIERN